MQALHLAQQLRYLGQRSFRWALLLVVACFLGLSGHVHVHAAERAQTPAIQAVQADSVMVAAHGEEACAVCVWKAHNPLAPGQVPPTDVTIAPGVERTTLMPRAPPTLALPFLRNRAPPAVLS